MVSSVGLLPARAAATAANRGTLPPIMAGDGSRTQGDLRKISANTTGATRKRGSSSSLLRRAGKCLRQHLGLGLELDLAFFLEVGNDAEGAPQLARLGGPEGDGQDVDLA